MKFLSLLDSNPTTKTVNLLYCKSEIEKPNISDTNKFIAWFEEVYEKDPKAFRIDLVQKSAFNLEIVENLENLLLNQAVILETDIYKRYLFRGEESINQIQMNRIEPCTPVHLKKYIKGDEKRVMETPELYENIVLPYINSIPPARTEWIRKVLNKEAEQSAVLFHDENPESGFILLPDSKWDQKQVSQLYLLAISQDSSIKSLRDLRGKHLKYLIDMRTQILQVLEDRFKLTWRDVRFVIHYQPSYYHFHVHVVNIKIKGLDGLMIGQCHLLEDVIEHLEFDPEYYAKRSLVYALNSVHPLFEGLAGHS